MKISRLAGLICVAMFALCLSLASVASASEPVFSVTSTTISGTSGPGTLEASTGEVITCTSDSNGGSVTGAHTVGGVVVTFTGCKGKSGSSTCTAKSPGAKEGQIITTTLKGELGSTKESSTGVGLLLEPASGTSFVTIQGSCLIEAAVSGSLAGEATPVKTKSTTGKLVFVGSKGSQNIKEISVLGSTKSPKLTAFGGLVAASEATTELNTFGTALEVT
jgi:hypothetical protein